MLTKERKKEILETFTKQLQNVINIDDEMSYLDIGITTLKERQQVNDWIHNNFEIEVIVKCKEEL